MKKSIAILSSLIFLLAACGSSQKKTSRARYKKGSYSQKYFPSYGDSIDDIIYSNLEQKRRSGVHYSKYVKQNGKFDIPYTRNKYVEKWVSYFTGKGRRHYARYLARLGRFMPYIHSVADKYGVPRDLVYLSMIESGFNIRARSWASAVGPWQFIRSTGAMYGLEADYYVDERRNVEKSTHAAIRHLKDLYDEFGHWYLAFAAYNSGSGKVRRAIKRDGMDYWDMVRGRYLRQETKDYVPKIIAAAIIAKNPVKYGFRDIRYQMPVAYEKVRLKGPTDLEVAAECSGVDPDLIRLLNPELLQNMTPPHIPNYELNIPKGTKKRFKRKYASLRPSQRIRIHYYTTDRGDTVKSVANQWGVKEKNLAKANPGKIDIHKKRVSKKVKVRYRRKGKTRYRWKRKRYTVTKYSVTSGQKLTIPQSRSLAKYSSSRDDTAAYKAAGKYGTQVAYLDKEPLKQKRKKKSKKEEKKKQKLAKAEIQSKSKVRSDLDPLVAGDSAGSKTDLEDISYIAGSSTDSPLAMKSDSSGMAPPAGPHAGSPTKEQLKAEVRKLNPNSDLPDETGDPEVRTKQWVPKEKPSKPKYHVVKKGDTLNGIARTYGVTSKDLMAWNGKKVSPYLLRGAKVKVSGTPAQVAGDLSEERPSKTTPKRSRGTFYVVKSGDTLSGIARRNRVSSKQLKAWNGKKVSPVLLAGAKIRVRKGSSVVKYKVKRGDNLYKIAKKHSTTPAKIKKLNGLKSHIIKPGAVLVVRKK